MAGSTSWREQWRIAEERTAAPGQTVRREDGRLSVGCLLAEAREQAFEDIRVGAGRVVTEYTGGTNGNPIPPVPANEVVDYMVEHHQWIVGTPDDCMAGIARLQEASGGVGGPPPRAGGGGPPGKRRPRDRTMGRCV